MKFTLDWLKDHLETDAPLEDICTALDRIGLEVESVANPAERLADFVIARCEHAEQHPDADKLWVCRVNDGKATHQVVCGAPNARTGLIGVFAAPGTYVPGIDLLLAPAVIRGVESNGMLCSERELEISDEHDGIIELDATLAARIGERFIDVMNLNDPVIEIAITPNRPDALGVRGVARDLAAAGLGTLKKEGLGYTRAGSFDCPIEIKLEFAAGAEDACPCFAGRYIRGVKNGPSPDWMQRRLRSIGLRPINAIVDVTNYVSYDRARPLHVYDADKLTGPIRARLGKVGEKFLALDGKEYTTDDTMTVIADDRAVLGFGGIMGGEESGCTQATTNVLIESAYFDPVRTAETGRTVGIHSDARYRFDRGIDPQSEILGVNLGAELITGTCGGEVSKVAIAGAEPDPKLVIEFDPARIAQLTGLDVSDAEARRILKSLGFRIEGKGTNLKIAVPSWRPDVHGPADLVEEVIRIVGIDTVPSVPMERISGVARPVMTGRQKRIRRARHLLAGRGLIEAITWSFIQNEAAQLFGGGGRDVELANPISSEMSAMRPSLLPGLLLAAQRNADHGLGEAALFEVGQIYAGDEPEQQTTAVTAIRTGTARLTGAGRDWAGQAAPVSVFDAKADAASVLAGLGIDASKAQVTRDAPDWFHPGRSGTFRLGPKIVLGHFGELHPGVLASLGVSGPTAGFEIVIENLPSQRRKSASRGALDAATHQPVQRDFAFVLDTGVAAGDVIRAAQGADKKLVSGVKVFDLYEGANLGAGKKSLAIEVTLQPRDKTLTDEEIDAVSEKVIMQVRRATGGEIRG